MNNPLVQGIRAGLPVAVSFISSFVVVGIFLRQAGFDLYQSVGMTALIFAGPAQYGVAHAIQETTAFWSLIALVGAINARFFVMSAALAPSFKGVSRGNLLFAAPLLSASTFVVTVSDDENLTGKEKFRFFIGVGLISYLAAILATAAGALLLSRLNHVPEACMTMILPLFFAAQMGSQDLSKLRFGSLIFGLIMTVVFKPVLGPHAILGAALIAGLAVLVGGKR